MHQIKDLPFVNLKLEWNKVIKKHRDTFTFGQPQKYAKVQNNINELINQLNDPNYSQVHPYSNEKQKRFYKNELLLESFHNKVGLVNKPSTSQLMIGDFIREKKNQQSLINDDLLVKHSIIHDNASDNNLIKNTCEKIIEKKHELKLRRRYTSKSNKKESGEPYFKICSQFSEKNDENSVQKSSSNTKNAQSIYSIFDSSNMLRKKSKNRHKSKASKIRLRNPSEGFNKLATLKIIKREHRKSEDEFVAMYQNINRNDTSTISWVPKRINENSMMSTNETKCSNQYQNQRKICHFPNRSMIAEYNLDILRAQGAYSRQKSITRSDRRSNSVRLDKV